jgi:hypothetical protein
MREQDLLERIKVVKTNHPNAKRVQRVMKENWFEGVPLWGEGSRIEARH